MKIFEIVKPSGKTRKIYSPDTMEKRKLRALVPQLNLLAEELDVHHVQHGFTEGRSPVTNAKVHIGWGLTVSFDLQDFFDTVTPEMVRIAIPQGTKIDLKDCFVDGAARQGLPTSPALANIAFSPADKEIMALCRKGRFSEPPWVYSRYADDLTFSCRTQAQVDWLMERIPPIVVKHGFVINPAKTHVQWAKAGRRVITGVSVGEKDISVPRYVRRRLRAAGHQAKLGRFSASAYRAILRNRKRWKKSIPLHARLLYQLRGLQEWVKLKAPKNQPTKTVTQAVRAVVVHATQSSVKACRRFGSFLRKFA
jgi:RNA-directed DNA polymerase